MNAWRGRKHVPTKWTALTVVSTYFSGCTTNKQMQNAMGM